MEGDLPRWYGGWALLTTNAPDLAWIALIFFGYALILLDGWFLPRYGLAETMGLAAAAVGVGHGTLIAAASAAIAVQAARAALADRAG